MDTNLSLYNQINSLAYWFLTETRFKTTVVLDAEKDAFYVTLKKGCDVLFTQKVTHFSKKDKKFLQFELTSIVNCLLHIKREFASRQKSA